MKVLSRSWILLLFILCCLNSSFAAVITSKATRSCHLTWVKVVISCLFTSNWKQFTSHTCGWARSSIRCRCALSLHRLIKKKKKTLLHESHVCFSIGILLKGDKTAAVLEAELISFPLWYSLNVSPPATIISLKTPWQLTIQKTLVVPRRKHPQQASL